MPIASIFAPPTCRSSQRVDADHLSTAMTRKRSPRNADEPVDLKRIWRCMERLQQARECSDEETIDTTESLDVIVDADHVCTPECTMRRLPVTGQLMYRCAVSNNVHACGDACRAYTVGSEAYVCVITGNCVGKESALQYTMDETGGGVTRDGFEVRQLTSKTTRPVCKAVKHVNGSQSMCEHERMQSIAERVVVLFLWSDARRKLETQIGLRHSRVAYRHMAAYIRTRTQAGLPIVLTDLQNLFVTEMHRTDGWMCGNAKPHSGRLRFLVQQCMQVQRMMQLPRVRAQLQSPIFQLGMALQHEYFSIATLYIMRDGMRNDKEVVIVKKDAYLNKYLPNLNNLVIFGFRKPRFSHATACVRMALCLGLN